MGNVSKPNTFTSNTTISPSEVNDNFDTIYNEFNGSIDASNLATDSVATAKIADDNVTTAKIADDAVTYAKIEQPVAFRATTTQAYGSSTTGSDITTYTEDYDLGSNFASGIFTAPYAGVYHFDVCVSFSDTSNRIAVRILKNSTSVATGFAQSSVANGDPAAGCSVTLRLAASDTVKAQIILFDGGDTLESPSNFSGNGS